MEIGERYDRRCGSSFHINARAAIHMATLDITRVWISLPFIGVADGELIDMTVQYKAAIRTCLAIRAER
jgi:hypothetical protein